MSSIPALSTIVVRNLIVLALVAVVVGAAQSVVCPVLVIAVLVIAGAAAISLGTVRHESGVLSFFSRNLYCFRCRNLLDDTFLTFLSKGDGIDTEQASR